MKEFIDKLIEKIVNTPTKCLDTYSISSPDIITGVKNGIEYGCASRQHEIIDIINELAEEYKPNINADIQEVIDKLEVYTVGRLNTSKVEISVLQLQRYINRLKQISEEYNNGWVPCSERLPEAGQVVLANVAKPSKYVNNGVPIVITEYEDVYYWRNGTILAWMPLPPAWKGDCNGKV